MLDGRFGSRLASMIYNMSTMPILFSFVIQSLPNPTFLYQLQLLSGTTLYNTQPQACHMRTIHTNDLPIKGKATKAALLSMERAKRAAERADLLESLEKPDENGFINILLSVDDGDKVVLDNLYSTKKVAPRIETKEQGKFVLIASTCELC